MVLVFSQVNANCESTWSPCYNVCKTLLFEVQGDGRMRRIYLSSLKVFKNCCKKLGIFTTVLRKLQRYLAGESVSPPIFSVTESVLTIKKYAEMYMYAHMYVPYK